MVKALLYGFWWTVGALAALCLASVVFTALIAAALVLTG